RDPRPPAPRAVCAAPDSVEVAERPQLLDDVGVIRASSAAGIISVIADQVLILVRDVVHE
ncbi:MAG: hypothetical protein ACYTGS_12705, partial [Planctomycetota bacterium]